MTDQPATTNPRPVFAGIDTHADTHHVAVIDTDGRALADAEFPTTSTGYTDLTAYLTSHGHPQRIGIEGTSSYGAAITHLLAAAGHTVIEVNRPDRTQRRQTGKSDPADAYAAAHAVRTGRATTPPKLNHGPIEQLRLLKTLRDSAVKTRTATINQIRSIIRTAPADLADQLHGLTQQRLITTLTRFRPHATTDPTLATTKAVLNRLAHRWQHTNAEITTTDRDLARILTQIAPELLERDSIGTQTAAQLLITAGTNPDRLHHEAAFARLTGVAPIPASSGKTRRHRLHRGGDRQANHALWRIAFNRTQRHAATQAYLTRRRAEQLSDKEILRCLKRAIVREIYPDLVRTINRLQPTP